MIDVNVGAVAAVTVSVQTADSTPVPYKALALKLCTVRLRFFTSSSHLPVVAFTSALPFDAAPSKISTFRRGVPVPVNLMLVSRVTVFLGISTPCESFTEVIAGITAFEYVRILPTESWPEP
ncbi:hypothetical protein D3C71_1891290 [compost metagenome]